MDPKKRKEINDAIKRGDFSIFKKKKPDPKIIFTNKRKNLSRKEKKILDANFIVAVRGRDFESLIELLNIGADIDATTNYGHTALMESIDNGHLEIAEFLIHNGAEFQHMHGEYGWTPISCAASNGHLTLIELLMGKGIDVHFQAQFATHGRTVLMHAARKCHYDLVNLLLNEKIDLNAQDVYGDTALIHAVKKCDHRMVKLLLTKGADPNIEAKYDLARYNPDMNSNDANFRLPTGELNPRGVTALDMAIHLKFIGIANILESHGAKP